MSGLELLQCKLTPEAHFADRKSLLENCVVALPLLRVCGERPWHG
jgi:hypothetical protein